MKLGKNGAEINQMLQKAYGNDTLKERPAFKWVQHFHNGREDFKDDARLGSTSTSCEFENIYCMRSVMLSDCQMTVMTISEALGLGK